MIVKVLVSPNLESRVGEAEKILIQHNLTKNHPDVLWFDDRSKLGVEQAKKIREHFSLKPFNAENRAVIIESSQNLTIESQNALLKTLEEPPESAILVLGADSENNLIPTIKSRCQIIYLDKIPGSNHKLSEDNHQAILDNDKFITDIEKLISSTIEQRFQYIETLKERDEFLKLLTYYFQNRLKQDSKYLEFTKQILLAEQWAKSNGNIRAILEYLMLKIPISN